MPRAKSWFSLFSVFEADRNALPPSPVVQGRDPRFYDEAIDVYSKALFLPIPEDNGWVNLRCWGDDRWPSGRELKRTVGSYILHFVYSGKGTINGVPLKAGSGFLTVPDKPHVITSDGEEPLQFFWCLLYCNHRPFFFESSGWMEYCPSGIGIFDYTFCFEAVCRLFRKGLFLSGGEQFVSYGIYSLFFEILSRCSSRLAPDEKRLSPAVRRAVDYIRCNYASDLSVQSIADSLHISRAHLRRLFVAELGVAPKEWITRCRIEAAVALIDSNAERSMNAISLSVGFSCYSQFVRAFRQIYGCSPRDYQASVSL